MASIFFAGISKVNAIESFTRLCKVVKNHNVTQVAFMKRVAFQEPRKKPPPFPYWNKSYNIYYQLTDPMIYRFDENTRLIVVDGPPAVGKSKLCENLAKEFGLLYMPAPVHDECYITSTGFDLRTLDEKLPLNCQTFDIEKFCKNPNDERVPHFQIIYFYMRLEQYKNALLHILSTGQGVILDRCVFSDLVFVNSMLNAGYIRKEVFNIYMHMRNVVLDYFVRPEVVIYLDVPVHLVQEKIKQRNIPYEVNSKVFTTQYLSDIEKFYKDRYLKKLSQHSHLLAYDWSKEGDYLDVVDDLEALDFDNLTDKKLEDWNFHTTNDVIGLRLMCDSHLNQIHVDMSNHPVNMPWPEELIWEPDEVIKMVELYNEAPGIKYEVGFDPELNDDILWKYKQNNSFIVRLTPRDFVNRQM